MTGAVATAPRLIPGTLPELLALVLRSWTKEGMIHRRVMTRRMATLLLRNTALPCAVSFTQVLLSNVTGYAVGERITRSHMTSLAEVKGIIEIQMGGSEKSWTWETLARIGKE